MRLHDLKPKRLMWKIWVLILLIIVTLALMILLTVRSSITQFIDEQVYETLQDVDYYLGNTNELENIPSNPIEYDRRQQESRSVNQLIFLPNGRIIYGSAPLELTNRMYQEALEQTSEVAKYQTTIDGEDVYYTIRQNEYDGALIYQASYAWDAYRRELVSTLFWRISILIGVISLLSLIPALWMSRELTKPIVEMERAVEKISNRQWETVLPLAREDELGQLARSIDAMRQELQEQDLAQQALLQNISHDLKTPIMVIRGYAQSIGDGIYPTGDLKGSAEVIDEEASRLEKKVVDLLYVTKLEYFKGQEMKLDPINLDKLVELLIDRFKLRGNLEWTLTGHAGEMLGDGEQVRVALENVLDNAIRYAESTIQVELERTDAGIDIVIKNDGPSVDENLDLFHQFSRGKQGKFGLGLFIVQRIVTLHGGTVTLGNTNDGVAVQFHFPHLKDTQKLKTDDRF
ncbi:HAMP domain-containing histidine kinase [Exiguobacterium sp. SH3S2]|uniref:sensor histidine kinase n=2 Tax=unclassified Exiguobacterium TaxID=2644629 RepID=UPI001039858E|nr:MULTISPECIES: HAMP domain-containing sensor histidine kinase [unclassified Exiguobacterium]TCI25450.1 HAMP domain-containing histidine kinase [Exiguobacterium sp. SH5S4]TCI59592.1 HAMP domain-containing histidine kinase [Exiguobacterium sp. SH3S2]TCI59937.1 HAMP domain-containing histidine kinase [Exiguobacterium sp. SH3S1]TCI65847.1 HAMP domain-containing histidine kinase [Exiguobacterium sp. SH0S2]TCI44135.1 HAMP domain-containing histidine kinase [Exiguobacterium sp. SH3S3]